MFVCIENNQITSIINYQPNVPLSVDVIEISNSDYENIVKQTHYFDVVSKTVKLVPQETLDSQQIEQNNLEHREFLSRTDWQVLRHIRQKALGIPTSLTEQEYLDLENQRQTAANNIINP